jgi:hypothetical protein
MGRAERVSAARDVKVNGAQVRGPPSATRRSTPAYGRHGAAGFCRGRHGTCARAGERRQARAREAGQASLPSGPKTGRRPGKP